MSDNSQSENLPKTFKSFVNKYPEIASAHEQVAKAAEAAGSLDRKTCLLVKVGICVGAGLESALRANIRKAMQAGATQEEVEQAILQGVNTIGFPSTVKAWSWAQVQFERGVD